MWVCQACMKRRLQSLVGDSSILSSIPSSRQAITANSNSRAYQRNYASVSNHSAFSANKSFDTPNHKFAKKSLTGWKNRQEWLDSRGTRPANKPARKEVDKDFVIRKHLQYLRDPLKLAEYVRRCLREGDADTTLAVVRAASKSIQCTVSWNHLIEWHLSQKKMNGAIRIYNEMKKRAQVPDARTYTIIFNGCASHPSATEALGRVVSIYQSMLTDRCPVKPNTIHVNAILKMCARARNMDAMFAIADQLPPKGLRAPNNLTFTTIINAIRIYAVNDLRSTLTSEQKEINRRKAMLDARRLWQDVTIRWRQGDLWIDEELVCAMGRTLLLGEARDHDDIMSLIEQAMNIPRQAPRLPMPPQKLIAPRTQKYSNAGEDESQELNLSQTGSDTVTESNGPAASEVQSHETVPAEAESEIAEPEKDDALVDQFQSLTSPTSPRAPVSAYAKPGPNTLSLLMQALLDLRLKEPAIRYWDLFTKQYGVKPDSENYHAYLRILRVARASLDTAKLLTEMPQSYMQHKTFRIAMSTCQRDKNNQNVFANAGKILDLMQQTQEVPDLTTLNTYLDLAMIAPLCSNKVPPGSTNVAKLAQGRQIMRALDRLGPSVVNIRSLLVHGDTSNAGDESREDILKDTLALTRRMISAHDVLISKNLVLESQHRELVAQRSKLSAFVSRYKNGKRRSLPRPVRTRTDESNEPIDNEKRDEQ